MSADDLAARAEALDAADPLRRFRELFITPVGGDVVAYLDGNSLGRPPYVTAERLERFVREEWAGRLIRGWTDGYHDDNIYFNSPYEYLPNMPDPWKYNHMGIILGTGEWDNTRHESYRLSEILNSKEVKHWLDDGKWRGHDWNYWRDMLPYYLSKL